MNFVLSLKFIYAFNCVKNVFNLHADNCQSSNWWNIKFFLNLPFKARCHLEHESAFLFGNCITHNRKKEILFFLIITLCFVSRVKFKLTNQTNSDFFTNITYFNHLNNIFWIQLSIKCIKKSFTFITSSFEKIWTYHRVPNNQSPPSSKVTN